LLRAWFSLTLNVSRDGASTTPLVSLFQAEYWWNGSTSTATPPTSTSDAVGKHNKIGSVIYRAALKLRMLGDSECLFKFSKTLSFNVSISSVAVSDRGSSEETIILCSVN